MYRKTAVVLSVLMLLLTISCNGNRTSGQYVKKATSPHKLPNTTLATALPQNIESGLSFDIIAESDELSLSFDKVNSCFQITDKRNGYIWRSVIDAKAEGLEVNKIWRQNLSSLFHITYSIINNKKQAKSYTASLGSLEPLVWTEQIESGIRIQYYINKYKIGFTVELMLKGDMLQCRIPADSVREDGSSYIISLDFAPFFGTVKTEEDGYFLVPDGSGALVPFNTKKVSATYRWNAYSPYVASADETDKLDKQDDVISSEHVNVFTSNLPVYGVKKGENAFVAFASKGDQDFSVNLVTAGNNSSYNRLFGQFTMRHIYKVSGSEITTDQTEGNDLVYELVDEYYIDTDRVINYCFLYGEQSDYSGMAVRYRSYLNEQQQLVKRQPQSDVPLVLDLFMGVREIGIRSNEFMVMTSFADAQKIVEELTDAGVKSLILNLRGWNKNGYGSFPLTFPPDNRLGGKKGLEDLISLCKEKGVKLTLEVNLVNATQNSASASVKQALIKNANGKVVTNREQSAFLINPYTSLSLYEKFSASLIKLGGAGVTFDAVGSRIYADYRTNAFSYRKDTVRTWQELLFKASEKSDFVGVKGGNLYALQKAQLIYDTPIASEQAEISRTPVPFLQMVLSNAVYYVSTAANAYYDLKKQMLQNLEYGALPYFELTAGSVYNLKNTEYNKLFSASYDQWKERLIDSYNMYNDSFVGVYGSAMSKHEIVSDDLVKITYLSGVVLYINYSEKKMTLDGVTVPEQSFLVKD